MRISDWSSDVCSSDLAQIFGKANADCHLAAARGQLLQIATSELAFQYGISPNVRHGHATNENCLNPAIIIGEQRLFDERRRTVDAGGRLCFLQYVTPVRQADRKSTRLNSSH